MSRAFWGFLISVLISLTASAAPECGASLLWTPETRKATSRYLHKAVHELMTTNPSVGEAAHRLLSIILRQHGKEGLAYPRFRTELSTTKWISALTANLDEQQRPEWIERFQRARLFLINAATRSVDDSMNNAESIAQEVRTGFVSRVEFKSNTSIRVTIARCSSCPLDEVDLEEILLAHLKPVSSSILKDQKSAIEILLAGREKGNLLHSLYINQSGEIFVMLDSAQPAPIELRKLNVACNASREIPPIPPGVFEKLQLVLAKMLEHKPVIYASGMAP